MFDKLTDAFSILRSHSLIRILGSEGLDMQIIIFCYFQTLDLQLQSLSDFTFCQYSL